MSVKIGAINNLISEFLIDKSYTQCIVLVDNHTKKHCYPSIKDALPAHKIIQISSGEHFKNIDTCQTIWAEMTKANLDRHALLINVGGGVIGDMGGFCAATYKRGIDFIQVPTTLLSQVDASVGGKLGIDFQGFKNHIGVFTLPSSVLIDPAFLKTLPQRELRSGFAEIIKHCLIRDKNKWDVIKKLDLEEQDFLDLCKHSVAIKNQIVTEDPKEKGIRKILNFGHTIGHAVETFFLDQGKYRLLHGEAIAVGMIAEAYLAFVKKMIGEQDLVEIEEFIFSVYGKVNIGGADFDKIIALTLHDKKNKGSEVRASLLSGMGSCEYDILITKTDIKRALGYYQGTFL